MNARQIDALLHKHLFGLPEYLDGWHPWEPEHYSTTWDGMGRVVEAMHSRERKDHSCYFLALGYGGVDFTNEEEKQVWGASFWLTIEYDAAASGDSCWYADADKYPESANADTAPMAVALAALRALGVEVPA